jgi:hypothetical protein
LAASIAKARCRITKPKQVMHISQGRKQNHI